MESDLRNTVLNMLIRTLEKKEFSNNVLNDCFINEEYTARDRAFIKRLYTGTIEKYVMIDHYIEAFSSVPLKKMKPVIRNTLRLSVYQMKFMDSVPVHSCIDEAVKLTRKRGFNNLTGFVNGVLRAISRDAGTLYLPQNVRASAPLWIYDMITEQYGEDAAKEFFRAAGEKKKGICVRFCRIRANDEAILKMLAEENVSAEKISDILGTYIIYGFESLTELKAFKDGLLIVQDPSSVTAAAMAAENIIEPEIILDVCAAPGGKSLYLAERFPGSAVISRDISENKAAKIRENAERLGINNITVQIQDALLTDEFMKEKADIVIADLPCSGLGVINKKPDILLRLTKEDLKELAYLQKKILSVVQSYVKPGGILLYSTCTINRDENENNAKWFIDHYAFKEEVTKQFLPGRDPYDGFFIARFKKY